MSDINFVVTIILIVVSMTAKCYLCAVFIAVFYAGSTMVILLTGSVGSVIHFVIVHVLERCVTLNLCSYFILVCVFVCSQGPTNCVMCTNSSLFVNRSNVIECVDRTCPVGWYDDGMNRECTYCDCVCNVNNPCAQVNVSHVLKHVAH